MFLRKRKSNLSLERAVYKPAEKDTDGKILVHSVRTTEYIGSMSAYLTYANAPAALLAKLDDAEKADLKEALKQNEPKADLWLSSLPNRLNLASIDLKNCAVPDITQDARKALEAHVKAAELAWSAFFKTAQSVGLRRSVNRQKKAQPEPAATAA